MILNDDDAPKISMNGRQKLFIAAIDLCILAELCVAMAAASQAPAEAFTSTFMKSFFLPFLPTLVAGVIGFRKLKTRAENA